MNSKFQQNWKDKARGTNTYQVTVSYGGRSFTVAVSADSPEQAEEQVFGNLQVIAK